MDYDVRVEIVVDDRHLSGRGRTTMLCFGWTHRDPLAVHLRLTAAPEHPSLPVGDWVVLRDFLRYGLDEVTGDGDIRIHPEPLTDRIRLDLRRDCGTCTVSAPRTQVRSFLDATENMLPSGAERTDADIEELINLLLER